MPNLHPVDIFFFYPHKSIIERTLILNARTIRFEHFLFQKKIFLNKKKLLNSHIYCVGFFTDASRKLNSVVNGSNILAQRPKGEWILAHDGADVVHGVSTTRPAIGQSILRRSRECVSSRVLSVSFFFFFSSAPTWKGAIAVKRSRCDGSLTIHTIYRVAPAIEATRRDFPSIMDFPTRIENYRSAKSACLPSHFFRY